MYIHNHYDAMSTLQYPPTPPQVHIYRQWVDDLTVTIPIFRSTEYNPYGNITHAWGGCFPHMQILHKGVVVVLCMLCAIPTHSHMFPPRILRPHISNPPT